MEGDLLVRIDSDGIYDATFVQTSGTALTGAGTVSDSGALEPDTTGLAVECSLNLDDCTCDGSWTTDVGSDFEKSGTFSMWIRSQ